MRIVTVCEQGLNRSVTAKWVLQFRKHEVIAAGVKNLSPETLAMLYGWADRIILLDARFVDGIPADKLLVWDVGPDRFHTEGRFHPELVALIREHGRATDWPN